MSSDGENSDHLASEEYQNEQVIKLSNKDLNDEESIDNNSNECRSNESEESRSNESEESSSESNKVDADQSDDDAPEQVDFSSTKKTAQKLAECQMSMLIRIKKQEQEKRKLNQERNIEQKKLKISNAKTDEDEGLSEDDSPKKLIEIERETKTTRLKIVLNDDDQVDKMNTKLIKKYSESNNRVVSFKDRFISTNSNIRRIENSEAKRLIHKRKVK